MILAYVPSKAKTATHCCCSHAFVWIVGSAGCDIFRSMSFCLLHKVIWHEKRTGASVIFNLSIKHFRSAFATAVWIRSARVRLVSFKLHHKR